MRHLIDHLILPLKKLQKFWIWLTALQKVQKCTAMWQMGKRLPLFFTNQVPEPVFPLNLPC